MRVLVTGASGGIGAALVPRLQRRRDVDLRAYGRSEDRARAAGLDRSIPFVSGDAATGAGLDEALEGVEVAYFLIHSMEGGVDFLELERRAAEEFAEAAQRAGTRRVVYLGGPVPTDKPLSRHLASRLAVEEILLDALPEAVAFRASIVIGPRSRSFRFLVRLVERTPLLPMPPWRANRGRPIDERDLLAYLERAGTSDVVDGPLSLDVAGPDLLSYGQMIETIRDLMILQRPAVCLPVSLTPVASRVAAAIAGEDVGLIEPLMESLDSDLLPRDERARELFPEVRLHRFEAAVERALREWERVETLAAR